MGIFLAIPVGKAISTLLTVTVVGGLVVFGTGVAAGTVGGAVLENQTGIVGAIGESVETGEMPSVADVVSNSQLAENYRENKARQAVLETNRRLNGMRVVDSASHLIYNGWNTPVGCEDGWGSVVVSGEGWDIVGCLPSNAEARIEGGCVAYYMNERRVETHPVGGGYSTFAYDAATDESIGRMPLFAEFDGSGTLIDISWRCDLAEKYRERNRGLTVDAAGTVRDSEGQILYCGPSLGAVVEGVDGGWRTVECVPGNTEVLVHAFGVTMSECHSAFGGDRASIVDGRVHVQGTAMDGTVVNGVAPVLWIPVEGGGKVLVAVCDFVGR